MMLYLVISTVHCDWGSQLVRINRLMSLPFLAVLFCSDMPITTEDDRQKWQRH